MGNEKKGNSTSDINLAAFMTYNNVKMLETVATSEGGRVRVWFNFDIDEKQFGKMKNDFFSQSDDSKVIAQRLFQERDRIHALMIQVRNNESNGYNK
jgi:hypothetical protein